MKMQCLPKQMIAGALPANDRWGTATAVAGLDRYENTQKATRVALKAYQDWSQQTFPDDLVKLHNITELPVPVMAIRLTKFALQVLACIEDGFSCMHASAILPSSIVMLAFADQ